MREELAHRAFVTCAARHVERVRHHLAVASGGTGHARAVRGVSRAAGGGGTRPEAPVGAEERADAVDLSQAGGAEEIRLDTGPHEGARAVVGPDHHRPGQRGVGGVSVDQVRISPVAEQERDEPGAMRVDRGGQRGAALLIARVGERRVPGEQAVHGGLLPGPDRGEEFGDAVGLCGSASTVELGAQHPPAREAVLARHRVLGVGQAGARVGTPLFREPVLGEFLQVLEAGTIG
jgi:hypothetical protein